MAFLEKFRTRVGNYLLGREITKSNAQRSLVNIRDAKKIGILFSSDSAEDVDLVKKYENYLTELGKKVKTIGYINAKDPTINLNWWPEQPYITRKEISWFYKPEERFIRSFVEEGFDVLLDLNINEQLPLMFVATLSKARSKVGRYSKKYARLYDFMIEMDETKTLKYFLRNIDTYMDMLNKGKNVEMKKH